MIMKKYLSNIIVFIFLFAVVFSVSGHILPTFVHAQGAATGAANTGAGGAPADSNMNAANVNKTLSVPDFLNPTTWLTSAVGWVAILMLKLLSLLTGLAGILLNYIVNYSVVDMAKNYGNIGAIDTAWSTIRDVANMFFIFILLYSSIKMIIGQKEDTRKLIVDMIIAAVLINFSLFFTKLVIDASNLVALTFYKALVSSGTAGSVLNSNDFVNTGLSNSLMQSLNIQSIWQAAGSTVLGGTKLISIGVMGSIVTLIVAFILFAIAIMFITRYVVLILVLIFSPIAFASGVLPGLSDITKQWKDALIGQSMFAPVYMLLTWVTVSVFQSLPAGGNMADALTGTMVSGQTTYPSSSVSILINFIVVIVFLILTLVLSKKIAGKSGEVITKGVSSAVFGTIGFAGRRTLGLAGSVVANNANLQKAADEKPGFAGAAARLGLYASRKARSGTFDVRNASVPTSVINDAVRGTIGRTNVGRKIGLDRFDEIGNIAVSPLIPGSGDFGKGAEKGFRERKADSVEKFDKINKANSEELRIAEASAAIKSGVPIADAVAAATAKDSKHEASDDEKKVIDNMEKAIAKMSDKEIETLVTGNKKLLESQAFATRISSQQLEALNKTDKLNESEKDTLKNQRFGKITLGLSNHAEAIEKARTTGTPAPTLDSGVAGGIRALGDKELEMVSADYFNNPEFVLALKPSQVEAIMKSGKFTGSQKKTIGDIRKSPFIEAIDSSKAKYDAKKDNAKTIKEFITKKFTPKDIAGIMGTKYKIRDPKDNTKEIEVSLLTHPDVIKSFKPNILKKMAAEMSSEDITTLRETIETDTSTETDSIRKWLNSNEGISNFS
jgi:hypothetical protein